MFHQKIEFLADSIQQAGHRELGSEGYRKIGWFERDNRLIRVTGRYSSAKICHVDSRFDFEGK